MYNTMQYKYSTINVITNWQKHYELMYDMKLQVNSVSNDHFVLKFVQHKLFSFYVATKHLYTHTLKVKINDK